MEEINGNLIQERVDLYLKNNWDSVIADIDVRVEKMMKSIIRETFSDSFNSRSIAKKLIQDKVDDITKNVLTNIEYDKQELQRLVLKKVEREVKKVRVKFE